MTAKRIVRFQPPPSNDPRIKQGHALSLAGMAAVSVRRLLTQAHEDRTLKPRELLDSDPSVQAKSMQFREPGYTMNERQTILAGLRTTVDEALHLLAKITAPERS